MTDSGVRGDEPGIKVSVEMMVGNGEVAAVQVEEATKGVIDPKASSPNKSSQCTPSLGSPKPDCRALAQKLALQGVPKSTDGQWGLLTGVSDKARQRIQGSHVLLQKPEHLLGRVVQEVSCQFDSPAVSGRHCTLTRKLITFDGNVKDPGSDRAGGDVYAVFVKDSSSNGTFINNEKLKKNGTDVRLRHGDIISLVALPEHPNAFAFVFREVLDDNNYKRKGSPSDPDLDVSAGEGKRIRGGKSAVIEYPVSLDDVRRLQKSNEDLRQQLEAHVLDSEKMRGEFRAAEATHVVELKEVRASVTEMHVQQIEEVRLELLSRSKELEDSSSLCVQQQTTIEDLNYRLASAAQSRVDAEEAIRSHTSSIAELKKRLEDEFGQRQKERVEWESNLEAAVERTRMEAAEELKRHSDASLRLQKEQQDKIVDLQEADKENRRLADGLRMKLEAERQSVMNAEEKGRRLGLQLQEERITSENAGKRASEFEAELRKSCQELESEKAGRESARAKVSSLELAMETAIRDLSLEQQRLQGARERIVLRETQLRAFYSTAAQVEALQQKQQKQLKLMLRTLEDGDGEGDYTQSRKSKALGQSGLGDEARMGLSQAFNVASPLPADQQTNLLIKGKTISVNNGITDDKNEKKLHVKEEEFDQKGGRLQPDWIDGDTQQEDEEGLLVSNLFSASKRTEVEDSMVGADRGGDGDEVESGPKVGILNQDDTQLLEHGLLATTQLVPENDSGECETVLNNRTAFASTVLRDRGTPSVDLYGTMSVPGGDGLLQDTDLENAGATMMINDSLQQGESEEARSAGDVPAVTTPTLKVGNRQGTQMEITNNEATICTQDLLTSEVLGSWAFGTQEASVLAESEVGSLRDVGGGASSAPQDDTQLEGKEYEGTMCTDDLLASEVAGSWAVGTPASVHADNDSSDSNDGKDGSGARQGDIEFGATHLQSSRTRSNVISDEVMQFADPVNSQNSLSPATTNPVRSDRVALSEMLDIMEPGFGKMHGLSSTTRRQSDIDDSTTDEDEDPNDNSDASQPMKTSPSVSVR